MVERHDYYGYVEILGRLRCSILDCTGAIDLKSPGYFNPSPEVDLLQACLCHFETLYKHEAVKAHPSKKNLIVAVFASGLLTFGCLEMAEVVLSNIQPKYETEHGCGYCVLLPMLILCTGFEFAAVRKSFANCL